MIENYGGTEMKKNVIMITKVFPDGKVRISAIPLPKCSSFLSSVVKEMNQQVKKGIIYSYEIEFI